MNTELHGFKWNSKNQSCDHTEWVKGRGLVTLPPTVIGEVPIIEFNALDCSACLIDLQTRSDCYSADLIRDEDGNEAVLLFGSGWGQVLGWPLYIFEHNENNFAIKGAYPLITDKKAIEKFKKMADKDKMPTFEDFGFDFSILSVPTYLTERNQ